MSGRHQEPCFQTSHLKMFDEIGRFTLCVQLGRRIDGRRGPSDDIKYKNQKISLQNIKKEREQRQF